MLDTETTGLEVSQGHRVIEIGAVELINRRITGKRYHQYIDPEREIDAGALEVHGITSEFLLDKPKFQHIMDEFMSFVVGAELIIHNAPFDVGFLDCELWRALGEDKNLSEVCTITDTLQLARRRHPGQRNSLDALCQRYEVDNSSRSLHGALLDAEILAEVYLAMTGGQGSLLLSPDTENPEFLAGETKSNIRRINSNRPKLPIIFATKDEIQRHESRLQELDQQSGSTIWRKI